MPGNLAIFIPHSGCPQQCSFCNQRTISGSRRPPEPEQAAALCRSALATLPSHCGQVEIAFFGGSFTAIDRPYMVALLQAVHPFLSDSRVKGIRVSTRPDAIDDQRLTLLQDYGVTAIELGAQSMDDAVLRQNRRGHTAQQVRTASALVQRYGFSLGLQMMTGLFGATVLSDTQTGHSIAALCPDTVRIYPTVVLGGTQLAKELAAGHYHPPEVADSIPLCADLVELFLQHGITVIRLGLHASEGLEGEVLGGCYHPAFGELVYGELYFRRILEQITRLGGSSFLLRSAPRCISQVVGQKKTNIVRLTQMGYTIRYQSDPAVADGQFIIDKR
ncbi:MAG: radical SAM protein [Angelakisella sp.]